MVTDVFKNIFAYAFFSIFVYISAAIRNLSRIFMKFFLLDGAKVTSERTPTEKFASVSFICIFRTSWLLFFSSNFWFFVLAWWICLFHSPQFIVLFLICSFFRVYALHCTLFCDLSLKELRHVASFKQCSKQRLL